MTIEFETYVVYRPFYGYLCHDGYNYDDLGWYELDKMKTGEAIPVRFRTRKDADMWRNRLPFSKKGWFGQVDSKVVKMKMTIETEGGCIWA